MAKNAEIWDVAVIGAGAAGLLCAGEALARGRRVIVLDHAARPGEKIRISGGGRCNFTNRDLTRQNATARFLSENPHFALSALSRFTPADFIARIEAAGIAWQEKHRGQLFCDGRATQVVDMLCAPLLAGGGELRLGTGVEAVEEGPPGPGATGGGFTLRTDRGLIHAGSLVIATGGKSIPKMGATGFGYRIAGQFGLRVTETRPGLVPLTFAEQDLAYLAPLAGLALPVRVGHGRIRFDEDLLFTHRGLSGPAVLQISNYWHEGEAIHLDLAPGRDIGAELAALRQQAGRGALHTALGRLLPERLAALMLEQAGLGGRLADQSNRVLDALGARLSDWVLRPVGSEGYRTAEVTLGGVATEGLDARTMEARSVPGLYFIGEVVDVTGWLGGYNFQWAWASGWAAGQVV